MMINFPKVDKSTMWDEKDMTKLSPPVVDFFLRRFSKIGECALFIRCGSGNGVLASVFYGVNSISMDTRHAMVTTNMML